MLLLREASFFFFLKQHQPREQSSLNPAWRKPTYWWFTDNCPLTWELLILKTLPYFIILPTAILPKKYRVSAQYLWKINKLKLDKYSSAYITKIARKLGGWQARKQVILILTGQLVGHHMLWLPPTVYPNKYAHDFCFAVLCCGYTLTDFPISIRLTSLALWQSNDCPSASKATLMNIDKYFM